MHLVAFFGLTTLYFLWQINIIADLKFLNIFYHISLLLIIGLTAESLQLIIPYRSFNYKDIMANLIGIISAISLFFIFRNPILSLSRKYLS